MELQNAKGTQDTHPEEKILINKVISTLTHTFELFGYNPIDFPILERYETLTAKFAAGEGSDALKETFKLKDQGDRDLALRFDLTVPFSRYIGMNPNIKMPFKKYALGNVFRDGPIKVGRFREFYQIDPDIVGVKEVIADAEIIALGSYAFEKMGIAAYCEYNSRKLLDAIMEYAKVPKEKRFDVIVSIDKLKKIGEKGVADELDSKNLKKDQIKKILECLKEEEFDKKITFLTKVLGDEEAIKEITSLKEYLALMNVKNAHFNASLARGLAYYTGPVFEFFLKDSKITSSIAAGGRYDDMIGNFLGKEKEYPATGISFGLSVILVALKDSTKEKPKSVVKVYIAPIKTLKECLQIASTLRSYDINVDMDLIGKGPSKNLEYANALGIPYVLIVGPKEIEEGKYKLKDMKSGEEKCVTLDEIRHSLLR